MVKAKGSWVTLDNPAQTNQSTSKLYFQSTFKLLKSNLNKIMLDIVFLKV